MAAATAIPAKSKPPQPKAEPKNIVLFSDGTGNSSAKVFKTNVWRMYEAVDLGPSATGYLDQISFYDDGVGTSNFKLLAALGGAFGWGLKRNVLDIYKYASRNYRKGDQIYGFGFSRGAFTIRLVMHMIASQGLVKSTDESDLDAKSRAAYRAFRSEYRPRKFRLATDSARKMRDRKSTYSSKDNEHPDIRFVGVWDTVAAYGGPIAEITRAIDNWIYPLSMPDYKLHVKVQCARQALAIDDERDAFWPLLWDEIVEEERASDALADKRAAEAKAKAAKSDEERARHAAQATRCDERVKKYRNRLQQVWFTGMHADVGGGYPDESLSYVSLLWMMEEAEKAGLRMIASIKDRFIALANSYGPMHDSRSGIGAYYRYQPRKIAAWLDWSKDRDNKRYLMFRDPDVRDRNGKSRGLLRRANVHESVIARINSGTVRYAPIALPRGFKVVPPQKEGETVEQATTTQGKLKCRYDHPPSPPLLTAETRARAEAEADDRFAAQENICNLAWVRRITYFATVVLTILLVTLPIVKPLQNPLSFAEATCSDSRCVLPVIILPLKFVAPGFAEPWIDAFARYPITTITLVALIAVMLWLSGRIERRLRDRSFHLWRAVLDGQPVNEKDTRRTKLRAFRESPAYQGLFRGLKFHALPALFGLLMVATIGYFTLVGLSQVAIQVGESRHKFCPADRPTEAKEFSRAEFPFDTSNPCVATRLYLKAGQVYEMTFQLPVRSTGEPVGWWDGRIPSRPGVLDRVPASSLSQYAGMLFRRVILAGYSQPIIETKNLGRGERIGRVNVSKLNLQQDADWPELYRVRVRALRNSSLNLFANEAHIPGLQRLTGWSFYNNNCGVAWVTIIKIEPRRPGRAPQQLVTEPNRVVPIPACANAPERVRIARKIGTTAS